MLLSIDGTVQSFCIALIIRSSFKVECSQMSPSITQTNKNPFSCMSFHLKFPGVLPEALRTRCGRCTKLQKEKSLDVITRLYYQHSQMYTALAERYDPTGEYTRNFERWFDEQNAVKPRPPIPQSQNFLTTRIPSTWITAPAKTKKITLSTTSSRPTLRTLPPTVRTAPPREDPPPVFRTQPATFRNPSQVPIIQTFEAPRTTPVPETIRTNPPTIRPTTVLFTEPLTTTTLRTTSYQPQLITSPPVERPTTQNEQPPVTVRVPQIIFEAPRIPVTESATIRVSIFPIRDETLPSTESDLREPSTVRTSLGPTRRPPSTRPPVAITRPSIAFDAESPVIFRAPATVRTLAPEPVRPVSFYWKQSHMHAHVCDLKLSFLFSHQHRSKPTFNQVYWSTTFSCQTKTIRFDDRLIESLAQASES